MEDKFSSANTTIEFITEEKTGFYDDRRLSFSPFAALGTGLLCRSGPMSSIEMLILDFSEILELVSLLVKVIFFFCRPVDWLLDVLIMKDNKI